MATPKLDPRSTALNNAINAGMSKSSGGGGQGFSSNNPFLNKDSSGKITPVNKPNPFSSGGSSGGSNRGGGGGGGSLTKPQPNPFAKPTDKLGQPISSEQESSQVQPISKKPTIATTLTRPQPNPFTGMGQSSKTSQPTITMQQPNANRITTQSNKVQFMKDRGSGNVVWRNVADRLRYLGESADYYLSFGGALNYQADFSKSPYEQKGTATMSGKGSNIYQNIDYKNMSPEQKRSFDLNKELISYNFQVDGIQRQVQEKYQDQVDSGKLTVDQANRLANEELNRKITPLQNKIQENAKKIDTEYQTNIENTQVVSTLIKGAEIGLVSAVAPPLGGLIAGIQIGATAGSGKEVVESFTRNPSGNIINLGAGIAGGIIGGGLGGLTRSPEVITRSYKPKVALKSVEVSDAIKMSTNPDGSINWLVKGKYVTEVLDKNGKVINTIKSEAFSRVQTAVDEAGAIKAVADSEASSFGKGAIRKYKKGGAKITQKVDLTSAKGSYNFQSGEGDLLTGTGKSTITETGKGFIKMTNEQTKSRIVKSRLKEQSSGLFNIKSKLILERPSERTFGFLTQTGKESVFENKVLGSIVKEKIKTKGYTREVPIVKSNEPIFKRLFNMGVSVEERIGQYLRKPKATKTGARDITGTPELTRGVGRSFSGEESIINLGFSGDGGEGSIGNQVAKVSQKTQSQAATGAAEANIAGILKRVEQKVKPVKETIIKQPNLLTGLKTVPFGISTGASILSTTSIQNEKIKEQYKNKTVSQVREETLNKQRSPTIQLFSPAVITDTLTKEDQTTQLRQGLGLNQQQNQAQQQQNINPTIGLGNPIFNRGGSTIIPGETGKGMEIGYTKKKKKEEDTITPYQAEVFIDATKGHKARWIQVADKVPLITAKSIGGQFVDETPSNRFRITKEQGTATRIINTAWNAISNKFREYSSKSGIRVGLKQGEYIERRKFRMDQGSERRQIRAGDGKVNKFFGL